MIAIVNGAKLVYGPATWNAAHVQEVLFEAGYTRRAGVFCGPDEQPVEFPSEEPTARVDFTEGWAVLPVVEVDEPAPEGKVLAGREPVVLEDRVEMRPVWVDAPPPPDPEIIKAQARAAINARRDALEFGIFTDTHGHRYDVDERSRARLTGAVVMSAAIPPEGIVWTDADNLPRTHTQASLLSLAGEILLWTDALHQHASYLKGKLERGEEYDIETGWPA